MSDPRVFPIDDDRKSPELADHEKRVGYLERGGGLSGSIGGSGTTGPQGPSGPSGPGVYAPSQAFEATLDNAPIGLATPSGMQVRILDNAGATVSGPTRTGLIETPTASGHYAVPLTAPATEGLFSVLWDDGTTPLGPDNSTSEQFVVLITGGRTGVPGDLRCHARPSASYGWLPCDGAAVSRTTYADLFTAIGTTYGAGDGLTTFNVPDLRGRIPVGVDGAAARLTANDALGQSSGAEKHTLTPTEMPNHQHVVGVYTTAAGGTTSGTGIPPHNSVGSGNNPVSSFEGGGGPHNNMPPYLIVNWEIAY